MGVSLEELAAGVVAGQRPALARALSLAERDPAAAAALLARLADRLGRAHVVGITGPPGAGKSTLAGVMLREFLRVGHRVAVLAVDPSSPKSGGALLGDRFRIGEGAADARCFIRSTATRGSLGGLTRAARQMVALMDAAGFDLVLVETVGTGQSEIDVAGLADSLLVVFPPGLGDEMQAIKAGILELADILVVTKSDTAAAAQACKALQAAAPLWRNAPPIHSVSARSGQGIADLAQAILARVRNPGKAKQCAIELAAQDSLSAIFQRMQRTLQLRLPLDAAATLTQRIVDGDAETDAAVLRVEYRLQPAGDSFQLGAVAGALTMLATEMNLSCRVQKIDLARGSMQVVLHRAA